MSNVNIRRAVENIKTGTNIYTPIVETVVNAIQAITAAKETQGKIQILVQRSSQSEIDGLPEIIGFRIKDNGIGFDDRNLLSFDTLYSDNKIEEGGKGFGRFTCLKYFDNVHVDSVFKGEDGFIHRTFSMGKDTDIIVNQKEEQTDRNIAGSEIHLQRIKQGKFPDKKLTTIAKVLVEKLLPYFITKDYVCPEIIISDDFNSDPITLNSYVENSKYKNISELPVANAKFTLGSGPNKHDFEVRLFKFYSPKSQRSKISLVADKREATETSIQTYIPEFAEEFYEKAVENENGPEKNFIIKAYVFSTYLDDRVSYERGGFSFNKEKNMLDAVSQEEIEEQASKIAGVAMNEDISRRQEKKLGRIQEYVENQAPWHRNIIGMVDFSSMPMHPTNAEIEERLQRVKFEEEIAAKKEVQSILEGTTTANLSEKINEIVGKIKTTSQNDLIHYVSMRRSVIDLFKRSLELTADGKYSTEGDVHDIIFPRKTNTDSLPFEEHNLWILDERLNFAQFVSSEEPLDGGKTERTDVLVFNNRVLFRGENEASNPITIFEFKRPGRDDFVNPSSTEDPIDQIIRYTNSIKDGRYKTPQGRSILVNDTTPFYGYAVCDLTAKVKTWLHREKNFKPMPDGLGWFQWYENINLYVEVLSWDKLLKDSEMRNRIFFHHLGI